MDPQALTSDRAHARCKLHEVAQFATAPIAEEGLKQITVLYCIEKDIRGLNAKAPLCAALKYIAEYRGRLCLFVTDGRIKMDNNAVERAIPPIALNRKSPLLAGHDAGAEKRGGIASLTETCKLNAVDPHAYLTDTLNAIVSGHKQSHINDPPPWNCAK